MTKWIFQKSHIFWKMFLDSQQDKRKIWDLQEALQEKKEKCVNIEANIEIMPFLIILTSLFHK